MWALSDWEEGLHDCGRHMSESLRLVGRPDPEYVVGKQVCLACKELDRTIQEQNRQWQKAHEDGYRPERYTLLRVYTMDEAKALHKQQESQARG